MFGSITGDVYSMLAADIKTPQLLKPKTEALLDNGDQKPAEKDAVKQDSTDPATPIDELAGESAIARPTLVV